MKNILLALLFFCSLNCAYAEYNADEIVLDTEPIQSATQNHNYGLSGKSYAYATPNKQQTTYLNGRSTYPSRKNAKFKREKQYKNVTVGAEYDTTFSEENVSQNRSVYSKYKINERFSVKSNYNTKTTGQINDQMRGTFSIAPEMKINNKMSLSSVVSRNVGDKSNAEEVKLDIQPFKDGRMNFNIGAGQLQYDDGSPTHSRINLGTQFRF